MADGFSTASADAALDAGVGTNWAYAALAKGDPGSAGTANPSSVTTREAVSWASASGASKSATNQPAWTSWAGTNGEVVTDLAFWSASTAGTFGGSMQIDSGTGVTMDTGDSLTLSSITVSMPAAS